MCGFFKELEKAAKQLDQIAKKYEPKKKTTEKTPKKQPTQSKEGDLGKYITIGEVAQITNLPIDKYSPYMDEEWEGGSYTSSDPKIHTYFQVWFAKKNSDEYNPDGVLDYFKEVTPHLKTIKGIWDEAYWSDSNKVFFVRKGQDVLQASTSSDSVLGFDIMRQLTEIIISKL